MVINQFHQFISCSFILIIQINIHVFSQGYITVGVADIVAMAAAVVVVVVVVLAVVAVPVTA